MAKELKYGTKVKDTLTSYKGKVTAIATYFDHCPDRVLVEGLDSTGRPCEWWVDIDRVKVR